MMKCYGVKVAWLKQKSRPGRVAKWVWDDSSYRHANLCETVSAVLKFVHNVYNQYSNQCSAIEPDVHTSYVIGDSWKSRMQSDIVVYVIARVTNKSNGANWIYPAVVSGAEHDGGVHVSGNDTLYWYANGSTYNGGTWLESDNNATFALSSSYGGDAALGAVPSTPTTNIWVTGAKHALFSGSGTVSIHPNRNVFIPNGGQMLLGTQGRLVIGGEIKGEAVGGLDYPTNTCLDVYFAATEHGDWNGTVVVGPGEGRTNDVGRMRVGACLEVASGVTRVSASSRFATGENAAMVFVAGIPDLRRRQLSETQQPCIAEGKIYARRAAGVQLHGI